MVEINKNKELYRYETHIKFDYYDDKKACCGSFECNIF